MHAEERPKGKRTLEILIVDGRFILKCSLNRTAWIELIWRGRGISDGLL